MAQDVRFLSNRPVERLFSAKPGPNRDPDSGFFSVQDSVLLRDFPTPATDGDFVLGDGPAGHVQRLVRLPDRFESSTSAPAVTGPLTEDTHHDHDHDGEHDGESVAGGQEPPLSSPGVPPLPAISEVFELHEGEDCSHPHENNPIRFAARNAELEGHMQWLESELTAAREDSVAAGDLAERVQRAFDRVTRKQQQTGLTETLGLILHHEREHLPNIRDWHRRLQRVEESFHRLSDVEFALESEAQHIGQASAADLGESADADGLIERRRQIVVAGLARVQDCSEAMTHLDSQCRHLIATIEAFDAHIQKNVLWIRSTQPLGVGDFREASSLMLALAEPAQWLDGMRAVLAVMSEHVVNVGAAGFFLLLVISFGSELRRRLQLAGARATGADGQVRMLPAAEAVVLTLVTVLAWPLFFWVVGVSLAGSLASTTLVIAFGRAMQAAAIAGGSLSLLRGVFQPDGLARRHFGWGETAAEAVFQRFARVSLWAVPLVSAVAFLDYYAKGQWSNSIGRIVFVAGMLLLANFLRITLNVRDGLLLDLGGPDSPVQKLRWPAMLAAVLVPLLIGMTAATGYYYSAFELTECLARTWCQSIFVVVILGLLLRAVDRAVQSFESNRTTLRLSESETADRASEEVEAATVRREIADSREQMRRFVRISVAVVALLSCWRIWHEVLPALNVVNDVKLWSMTQDVAQRMADPGTGSNVVQTMARVVPITLGDLIRACLILAVTIAASKNLPGLLDTLLLRRLPFDRGGRHAISTICRYLLTTAGTVLALSAVGVDWASVQWLVAAMTVGLGFGLQEIFANFVSGLIILLERPIRIGDFVTVNGQTGFVTRIQFRATTITDLDRRELLVPNKKFITDELVNWTLSDPITRLVVPLGIAYGSDTSMAHRLLLEVAHEHPVVLDEPPPSAVMTGFGDSTLDFELRVYIPRRDEFAQILHDLNTAIDRKFRAAKIEIAFPQCDINVRGLEQVAAAVLRKAA